MEFVITLPYIRNVQFDPNELQKYTDSTFDERIFAMQNTFIRLKS